MPSIELLWTYFGLTLLGLGMMAYMVVRQIIVVKNNWRQGVTGVEISLAFLFLIILVAHILPLVALGYEVAHLALPPWISSVNRQMNLIVREFMVMVIWAMFLIANKDGGK